MAYREGESHPCATTPASRRGLVGAGLGAGVGLLAGIARAAASGDPPFFIGDAHTFGFHGSWLLGIPGGALAGARLGALTGPRRLD